MVLVAASDPRPDRRAIAGRGVRQFPRWQDLVGDPQVDVVLVASPSDTHAEIGLAVLAAGKHLFLEKPIALTQEDAIRLGEAKEQSGRTFGVGLFMRHHALFRSMRAKWQRLGRPLFATSSFHNHLKRRQTVSGYERHRSTGGGVLFDLAYHHFDLCRWLFNSDPVAVDCRIETGATEDDSSQVLLTLANGVRINGTYSSRTLNENRIEVFGEEGRLVADMYRMRRASFREVDGTYAQRVLGDTADGLRGLALGANIVPAFRLQAFVDQLRGFVDAVARGSDPSPGIGDAILALRVVLAAYESARTRREVPV